MNNEKKQELFVKYLKNKYGEKNLTDEKVKELKDSGQLQKDYQDFEKTLAKKAAHGTKLNYFKSLKHQCAEDEELYYYKKGGAVECGCKKKGGEVNAEKNCGGGPVAKFKKMRQGGQSKVVNGSTKQPTIQGTAKMQEERKTDENMTWDPKIKKMRKMTSAEIARTKKNQADARQGQGEGEPQHKCGGKVKKNQEGSSVVKKFKAKCGSKIKKNQQGGSLIDLLKK